jgi:hypothetical protein
MLSYIGAFPFLQDAPAVLGLEQTIMVIVIMTERYRRVLARGSIDRTTLLFKSLAVFDRKIAQAERAEREDNKRDKNSTERPVQSHVPGFAIDEPGDDEMDDEDDDLVLAAFEALDIDKAVRQGDAPTNHGAMIPADNFRKLIMILLVIAPMHAQEHISKYSERLIGEELNNLRSTAENILASFLDVEKSPGIKFGHFSNVVPICYPHLFSGFNALFEHFLFSSNLDFSKRKEDAAGPPTIPKDLAPPLLEQPGEIMDLNIVSQLSFFIPGTSLFRRLRPLYSGNDAGFSMGSFETKVFNWRAPTILLVRGTRISDIPQGGQESSFAATLPPRRFPHGSASDRLTFGVYVSQPWRHTHKECFGESDSILFQLEPVHDVFAASVINRDYVSFTKAPGNQPCIAFGCPHPKPTQAMRRDSVFALGPVSLLLDSSFEFGVFTHNYTSHGGAFRNSIVRKFDFQDRFEIESLEVWGCGGDEEAKIQAERWAWEAREAEARRRINLGTGDIDADRALLEMAGLIGQNRSGGSMN